MISMKKDNGMTSLDDEPLRSESVRYATGEEQRVVTNSFRKNEVAGPKQKWLPVVDVSCGESKVWWYKEDGNIA